MLKKWLALAVGVSVIAVGLGGCSLTAGKNAGKDIVVEKSTGGNPVAGFDQDGKQIYGGDPAALVDGDTVYLYTGHDTASKEEYVIPEWQCYSTKDMKNWTYEGVVMQAGDISWARNDTSAWAAQTAKHYDPEQGKDQYYLYYCTWDKTSGGKQSIGAAVSDSPKGPFKDIGHPLIKGMLTKNQSSNWNDIDPTVWIEKDASGEEHRYLMWGNSKNYICELNEDMVSVKDLDGDGTIAFQTDILEKKAPDSYSEAPWIYRRQDENGNYYGSYYLFYAYGWREQMAYATTDNLLNGKWKNGDVIMEPTATSNTNHMSVIDFKGKTYFIYHNGSLPGGSGFRRVVCVEQMKFNEDGTIKKMTETSTGLNGTASYLTDVTGDKIGHNGFKNSISDTKYPYTNVKVGTDIKNAKANDYLWEVLPGKYKKDQASYVSIEAYNKPGLYLTEKKGKIVLAQDATGKMSQSQTFKTVGGLSGKGVSFESLKTPKTYLTIKDGVLVLTDGSDKNNSSFEIKSQN